MSGVLAVILSAAQELCVRRARPFAEFTLSKANVLRVTGILSKCPVEKMLYEQYYNCSIISSNHFSPNLMPPYINGSARQWLRYCHGASL